MTLANDKSHMTSLTSYRRHFDSMKVRRYADSNWRDKVVIVLFSRPVGEEAIHKAAISPLRSRTQMPRAPSLVGTSRGGPLPIEEVTR